MIPLNAMVFAVCVVMRRRGGRTQQRIPGQLLVAFELIELIMRWNTNCQDLGGNVQIERTGVTESGTSCRGEQI